MSNASYDASVSDPFAVLGVGPQADNEEIRAAYLALVKQYPPDRSPEQFERVRDAYEALRDPRRRARYMLFSGDPDAPLAPLAGDGKPERNYVGPDAWIAVLKGRP